MRRTIGLLTDLARECGVEQRRDAMLRGEPVNATEGRAVLHTALRAPAGRAPHSADGACACSTPLLAYAERVRDTAASGIRHVVNIGIGGSDLGPQMVVRGARRVRASATSRFHFVSNVDGHDLRAAAAQARPAETLFVIASKTFTTQETMANAQAARAWF